jgi:hypothetical protein
VPTVAEQSVGLRRNLVRMSPSHPVPTLACKTQESPQIEDLQPHFKDLRKSAVEGAALLRFPAATHYGTPPEAIGAWRDAMIESLHRVDRPRNIAHR